jgi:hypothetical protein
MDYIDKTILEEAASLVEGDRGAHYGPPTADFDAIGLAWSAILSPLLRDDILIDGEHVALCMAALKLVRQSVGKPKRDNLVDVVGYVLALDHVERSR